VHNRRASRCEPARGCTSRRLAADRRRAGQRQGYARLRHQSSDAVRDADRASFGPVHTRIVNDNGETLPCHARRDGPDEICEHGQPTTCTSRHGEDDSRLDGRCAWTAGTTPGRCCGTRTLASCGDAPALPGHPTTWPIQAELLA